MQLTPHFSLEELTATQHRGIDNSVNDDSSNSNLRQLAFKLETVRSILGYPLVISSGYRCLELNRAVGSKDTSAHVKGLAADWVCPKYGTPETVFEYLLTRKELKYDQLILEDIGGKKWIHIGLTENPSKYRQQALIIDKFGTHTV